MKRLNIYQINTKTGITDTAEINTSSSKKPPLEWMYFQNVAYRHKEVYYIEAIRNYIRKINFIELIDSLNNEEITQEDFDLAIEINPDKYIVTLKEIINHNDLILINDMIKKIGFDLHDFTISEVAELFSIKEECLTNAMLEKFKSIK